MRGFQRVIEEADASNLIGDVRLAALAATLLATFGMASAQQAATPEPPSMSQRVLRDADSPFRWIKIQSESVRKASAAAAPSSSPAVASPPPVKTAAAKAAPSPKVLHVASAATASPEATANAAAPITAAAHGTTSPRADNTSEEPLVNIDRADPEWDEDVMRTLRRGRVVVRFNVAEDGYLSRIQIVESSNSRLTGPVMGALMQWRFEPIAEPRVATVEFGFDLDSGRR